LGSFSKVQPHQLILDEERDNVGEVHLFLLSMSKIGHAFSFSSFLLSLVVKIPIEFGRRESSEQKFGR